MKLSIKWKGVLINSFECDASDSILTIKSQIFSITNVEPKNQKLMFKGKILKNNETLTSCDIKEDSPLLLMGTPSSSIPKTIEAVQKSFENTKKIKLTDSDSNSSENIPRGIYNLGNTCYLNSSIQTLLSIPEIRDIILREETTLPHTPLSKSIKDFLLLSLKMDHDMENNLLNDKNHHEAIKPFSLLLSLHSQFPQFAEKSSSGMLMQHDAEECFFLILHTLSQTYPSIGALFEFSLQSTLTSIIDDKCDVEEEVIKVEKTFKMPCHISNTVSDLKSGITKCLEEDVTKENSKGISTVFKKKTKILNDSPQFLAVNFMRFFWKPKEQVKAKILKQVTFPLSLDVDSFSPDSEFKKYDLISVLTHIGRSSDSGHYMSWVRQKDSKIWWKCDDDKIISVGEEDVKKLDGGGDWHTAYLCIYRRSS